MIFIFPISLSIYTGLNKIGKVGFESIILLYQPTTFETADVLSTYVYRTGIQSGDYGLATAAGLFEALIALALVLVANALNKKVTNSSMW